MASLRIRLSLCRLLVSGLFSISALFAQTSTASLTGTVRDSSGALLPGVRVTVIDSERNTSLTTLSNDVGSYVIPVLNAGTYVVTGELAGFKRFSEDGFEVLQMAGVGL